MTLRDLATCPATTCTTATTIQEAAWMMAMSDIGFLIVVGADDRPVGVITDRDITLRAVARGRPADTPVGDVMTHHVNRVSEGDTVERAASVMADKYCRRLAVVDDTGHLVGVLSLDDLLPVAGHELEQVARAVRGSHHGHAAMP